VCVCGVSIYIYIYLWLYMYVIVFPVGNIWCFLGKPLSKPASRDPSWPRESGEASNVDPTRCLQNWTWKIKGFVMVNDCYQGLDVMNGDEWLMIRYNFYSWFCRSFVGDFPILKRRLFIGKVPPSHVWWHQRVQRVRGTHGPAGN